MKKEELCSKDRFPLRARATLPFPVPELKIQLCMEVYYSTPFLPEENIVVMVTIEKIEKDGHPKPVILAMTSIEDEEVFLVSRGEDFEPVRERETIVKMLSDPINELGITDEMESEMDKITEKFMEDKSVRWEHF